MQFLYACLADLWFEMSDFVSKYMKIACCNPAFNLFFQGAKGNWTLKIHSTVRE
jgi:hypothetical protein